MKTNHQVASMTDRRVSQIAREYLSEYGTVDRAITAVVHGSELTWEAAERVCSELERIDNGD